MAIFSNRTSETVSCYLWYNFRPQLLLLLSMPWSKELVDMRYLNLINLASQLKASRGLTIVVAFLRGNPLVIEDRKKAEEVCFLLYD